MFVKVVRQIGALAKFAIDAERVRPVRNASLAQRMGNLRSHPANNLVILDCHQPARSRFHRGSDGVEVHAVDERIVDDRRLDAFCGELFAGIDRAAQKRPGADQHHVTAGLKHLRLAPGILRAFDPVDRVVFASDKKDAAFPGAPGGAIGGDAADGFEHQGLGFIRARRADDQSVRNAAHGREVRRGLMTGAVGGVLEADMREQGDHGSLRQGGHRERQISLGDTKLAEGIDDGNEAGLGETGAGADHVRFGHPDFEETVGKTFLKGTDPGRALDVR